MVQIINGKIRVQLFNSIIRLEFAANGKFCDENTFFIPERCSLPDNGVSYSQEGNAILFDGYKLYIPENATSLSGIRLEKDGKKVYNYKKLANSGELPALDKTPEVFAVSDNPRIIIPEGGYTVHRNGEYAVTENVQDIYLLLCRKDAKLLRKLYVELTGRCELVRLSTLGGWNSKYYAYTEEEAKQLISDYEAHNVPLDVMVIDTDWRSCENGWGYDINEKLFPDMKRFFDFAHSHGVEVCFNDHPEPVNGAQVFAPEEIAYRESNLQSLMEKGLDIWWYDRNWGTHLISPTDKIYWETLGLYLFEDITKNYFRKSGSKDVYIRPVIMGNAVNIINGNYQSITDSASHRYSVQWTGDISSMPDSLSQEVSSLIKCGNNAIAYINADCGGHIGNPDKELFVRWMQFGTLSPVFRPHCTNTVIRTREPWAYDEETLDIVRDYNNLRYRLLPVIYKNAFNAYLNGEPIFKSLGFEYPEDKRALKCKDVYMLGNNIIVSPIGGVCPEPVNGRNFVTPVKAVYYDGRELQGEPIATAEYENLDIFLNHTSPEAGVPVYDFSARFEAKIKPEKAVQLFIKCDDGATVWIDGKKVLEDKTLHSALLFPLQKLEADREYDIKIEYFQAGGEAACQLCCCEISSDKKKPVYLPAGRWLNPFDGKIYNGGKTVAKTYGLREMPLFVRMGALIPLAYEAQNTKLQKWDKLVYDFYPCKNASDSGYLYEDDTQTTAYKSGKYRKSAYESYFSQEENAFAVKLSAAEGSFDGDKCFNEREITIKCHLIDGVKAVKKVALNGVDTEFVTYKKRKEEFPLSVTGRSADSNAVTVKMRVNVTENYEIKFYI